MAGSRAVAGVLVLALAAAPLAAAQEAAAAPGGRVGRIEITLPPGGDAAHEVSVTFGDGKVAIEVPRGSSFPLDFAEASNGLLRSGEVLTVDRDRLRLDLKLASGIIDRVDFAKETVRITFQSRFTPAAPIAGAAEAYRLGPDDRIQVAINGDPELTRQFVVGSDGKIAAPLLGVVSVGGLSVAAASAHITELLARDYLVDPKVDLQVIEYNSQWVMVTGDVGKPGRVALKAEATLKDALSDAGGISMSAGDEIVISRDAPNGAVRIQIPIDRAKFERAESNPKLQSGDIVNVVSRPYVYVLGEVRSPGKVPLERGMTLLKAVSSAGGLTEWAKEKKVQIISEGDSGDRRVFNLKDIRGLKISDPILKGGDTVFVERRFL